ncbi:MAG: MFS transporter [Chloroflexi bacterium]|nr:MFS transporter [Chloroflexota bacterium]
MSAEGHREEQQPVGDTSGFTSAEPQPRYAWVVMGNLWGMDLANVFVFMSIGVLIPIWKDDIGITPLQAGLMGSAGFFGFGLMALPASIWLTKYNPRLITLICSLGMAGAALLHAVAPSVEVIILARFTFVLLAVSRIQMQIIFIQQWFKPRLYAVVNSLDFSNRSVGQTLAVAITPALVGLLGGWRAVYVVLAIALVILSLTWSVIGRERRRSQAEGGPAPQVGSPAGVLKRHKVLWIVAGCQIGAAVSFASLLTFYPTYAIESLDLSVTEVGFLMSFFPIGGILGSLSAGAISQRIGLRKPLIWIPGIFLPVFYFTLLRVDIIPLAGLLLLGIGFFAMAVPPILSTIPLDMRLPPREVAVALGLLRTLFPIGATFGPLLVGAIQEGGGSLFLALSIVSPMPITLLIGGRLLPETGPKKR